MLFGIVSVDDVGTVDVRVAMTVAVDEATDELPEEMLELTLDCPFPPTVWSGTPLLLCINCTPGVGRFTCVGT